MKTLLKWAGGKEREWKFIKPRLPQIIKNYYEPFLGGGAVFFNIDNIKGSCYLNDISVELISFYNIIKNNDRHFIKEIENINNNWLGIDKIYKKKEDKIIEKYIHFKNNELSEKESSVFIKKVAKSVTQSLIKQSKNQTILYDEFVKSLKNKFRRTKKLENDKGTLPSKDISDIFLSSLKSGFYTYIREDDLDSIMDLGLASSIRIANDKEILNRIYKDKKQRRDFVKRIDDSDPTQMGPSIFFNKPLSIKRIKELDPEHPLSEGDWVLLKINYSELKSDDPSVYIYGLELVPYEDEDYDDIKSDVEGIMSEDELNKYIKMRTEETWSEFKPMSGYFAANVPHGVLINKDGLIDPKYLSLNRIDKISRLYNYIFK